MKCSVNPNSVVYMYIVYNIVHMHKHLDCCIHSINNRSFQHNSLLFVYKHFSRSWEKYLKKNILIFNSTLAKVGKNKIKIIKYGICVSICIGRAFTHRSKKKIIYAIDKIRKWKTKWPYETWKSKQRMLLTFVISSSWLHLIDSNHIIFNFMLILWLCIQENLDVFLRQSKT